MKAFNHAFTIAFSYESLDPDATEIDDKAIRDAIISRAEDAYDNNEILEAIGAPFDSYEFPVEVYKTEHDFMVVINGNIFEMSHNASSPNGANIHIGNSSACRYEEMDRDYEKLPDDAVLPAGVVSAIEQRLNEGAG